MYLSLCQSIALSSSDIHDRSIMSLMYCKYFLFGESIDINNKISGDWNVKTQQIPHTLAGLTHEISVSGLTGLVL